MRLYSHCPSARFLAAALTSCQCAVLRYSWYAALSMCASTGVVLGAHKCNTAGVCSQGIGMRNIFDLITPLSPPAPDEPPWLLLGKGPTLARRHDFDLTQYTLLGLNDV